MSVETRFIPHALRAISEAVVEIIGKTGLHVRKDTLSQRLARRARGRIKALEQMLRRVIMLMALELMGNTAPALGPMPRIRVLAGVSIAPRPKPARPKRAKQTAFGLPPAYSARSQSDFTALPRRNAPAPVSINKLIKRIQALQHALETPEAQAQKLAKRYARLRAKKAPMPLPPPDRLLRRAGAELGLIAGALPMELTRALAKWHDTS